MGYVYRVIRKCVSCRFDFMHLIGQHFGGQNPAVDKIFGTKSKFREFCPPKICPLNFFLYFTSCILPSDVVKMKYFHGQNFWQKTKLSALSPAKILSDKVLQESNILNLHVTGFLTEMQRAWLAKNPLFFPHPENMLISSLFSGNEGWPMLWNKWWENRGKKAISYLKRDDFRSSFFRLILIPPLCFETDRGPDLSRSEMKWNWSVICTGIAYLQSMSFLRNIVGAQDGNLQVQTCTWAPSSA